ncbi:NUDIX domain-containing protein [Streptomyces sp. NPDC050982]|uniref:NUDIX hydrolase n=1 Tax=Streptomyces sp. NPDC050982 TaxID=3154746 RepID=UPI0034085367
MPDGIDIISDEVEAAQAATAAGVAPDRIGVVHADPYITVVRDPVRFPDDQLGVYGRIFSTSGVPGVVVLPLLDDLIILVEHFRHATRSWHIEAPRGFGRSGSTDELNAARELSEEIGSEVIEMIPLGIVYPDTGMLADHAALFAARIESVGELDKMEGIRRVVPMTGFEIREAMHDGTVNDGFTIAAVTRAWLAGLVNLADRGRRTDRPH